MGFLRARVTNPNWDNDDVGTIMSALVTLLNDNGLGITSLSFDSPTILDVTMTKTPFTYADFNTVKVDLDALITGQTEYLLLAFDAEA